MTTDVINNVPRESLENWLIAFQCGPTTQHKAMDEIEALLATTQPADGEREAWPSFVEKAAEILSTEQERLSAEGYLMDSDDCIAVLRESVAAQPAKAEGVADVAEGVLAATTIPAQTALDMLDNPGEPNEALLAILKRGKGDAVDRAIDWLDSQKIAEREGVEEALRVFSTDSTLDNATALVIAIRTAASPATTEQVATPELAVWYGPMPESNGKSNYTAVLYRKGDGLMGGVAITLGRSEYPDRVRYEADRARYLIGELEVEPCILDYDPDKHSGYVATALTGSDAREGKV
jgi:hypothetical protein